MIALRALAVLTVAAVSSGCIVTRASYEAEVARGRALEHEMRQTRSRYVALQGQNRDLVDESTRLRLERRSLDSERVELLSNIEDLRGRTQRMLEDLEDERTARLARESDIRELTGTYTRLVEELEGELESGRIEIHRLKGRLQVRALDQILFDSGSVTIKEQGREVLAKVAQQIQKVRGHSVRVEGHTDDVPISTARFPSNWELSAARAAVVVRHLIASGLEEERLSAAGYGSQKPIADNSEAQGRSRNRRIEIVLVPEAPGD